MRFRLTAAKSYADQLLLTGPCFESRKMAGECITQPQREARQKRRFGS